MTSLVELRDIALEIALAVAPIPSNGQPKLHDARTLATDLKTTHLDLVTELDRATETAILRELACDELQGFLFARPMSGAALLTWMGPPPARTATLRPEQGDNSQDDPPSAWSSLERVG